MGNRFGVRLLRSSYCPLHNCRGHINPPPAQSYAASECKTILFDLRNVLYKVHYEGKVFVSESKKLTVVFYRSRTGTEPVRDWLKGLPVEDRQALGRDLRLGGNGLADRNAAL